MPAAIFDLVLPEVTPFDPPSYHRIKHEVDWTTVPEIDTLSYPANLSPPMRSSLLYATRCRARGGSI